MTIYQNEAYMWKGCRVIALGKDPYYTPQVPYVRVRPWGEPGDPGYLADARDLSPAWPNYNPDRFFADGTARVVLHEDGENDSLSSSCL